MPLSEDEILELRATKVEARKLAQLDDVKTLPVMIHILGDIKKRNEEKLLQMLAPLHETINPKTIFTEIEKEIILPNLNFADIPLNNINRMSLKEAIKLLVPELCEKLYAIRTKEIKLYLINQIFLTYAIHVYTDADEKQNMNIFSLGYKMSSSDGDDILKPFRILYFLIMKVAITEELQKTWYEAAVWFMAMHDHTYNQIPDKYKEKGQVKQTDGLYPAVDVYDSVLQKFRHISKYDIVRYHLANARVIGRILREIHQNKLKIHYLADDKEKQPSHAEQPKNQKQLEVEGTVTLQNDLADGKNEETHATQLPAEPLSIAKNEGKLEQTNESPSLTMPKLLQNEEIEKPSAEKSDEQSTSSEQEGVSMRDLPSGATQIMVTIPSEKKHLVPNLFANTQMLLRGENNPNKSNLYQNLLFVADKGADEKIRQLKYCINLFTLSKAQQENLSFLRRAVIQQLTDYQNSTRFLAPTHYYKANELIEFVKKNNDPQEQLLKLYDLRKYLKKLQSVKLIERVDQILLDVYRALLNSDVVLHRKRSIGVGRGSSVN